MEMWLDGRRGSGNQPQAEAPRWVALGVAHGAACSGQRAQGRTGSQDARLPIGRRAWGQAHHLSAECAMTTSASLPTGWWEYQRAAEEDAVLMSYLAFQTSVLTLRRG